MSFLPCDPKVFFKKMDPRDVRLGEIVMPAALNQISNLPNGGFAVLGYPDDEGIANNGGRLGAKEAPDKIRTVLYKTTPTQYHPPQVYDFGNLSTETLDLEARHVFASETVSSLLSKDYRILSLGGGHDYGFPDGNGFMQSLTSSMKKPLVLNFDAHLDVRPYSGKINSGTPFYRLLEAHPGAFDFVEVGIQSQCNSPHHVDWLKSKGGKIITWEDLAISQRTMKEALIESLVPHLHSRRPTYLSVDIDAFANAEAPGCSQSWPVGLQASDFMVTLSIILERVDVRVLGIYEVSPPLDIDNRTAKLASQIAHRFLFSDPSMQRGLS